MSSGKITRDGFCHCYVCDQQLDRNLVVKYDKDILLDSIKCPCLKVCISTICYRKSFRCFKCYDKRKR